MNGPISVQLIECTTDELIELIQRMKNYAAENSVHGETVLIPFKRNITLAWSPEPADCKYSLRDYSAPKVFVKGPLKELQ